MSWPGLVHRRSTFFPTRRSSDLDLRDVLKGVDAVTKSYPVDEKRIGIAGWSYGGYMTMWTVTQTNRFRDGPHGHVSAIARSEEHTSELQSLTNLVCRLLPEKKND